MPQLHQPQGGFQASALRLIDYGRGPSRSILGLLPTALPQGIVIACETYLLPPANLANGALLTSNTGPEVLSRSRAGMRRAALLHELSFTYSLDEYKTQQSEPVQTWTRKRQTGDSRVPLPDDQKARFERWFLHEKLLGKAIPGYIQFAGRLTRSRGSILKPFSSGRSAPTL